MSFLGWIKKKNGRDYFYWREILSVLFLLIGFYFFREQRAELARMPATLQHARPVWLLSGTLLGLCYIALQAFMYMACFSAVQARISFKSAVELFLKRNLIGIFLPAGGVTSQAFFTSITARQGVSHTKTGLASYLFVALGIASLSLVGLPVIFFLILDKGVAGKEVYSLLILLALTFLLGWITLSIYKKGWWFRRLGALSPGLELILSEISVQRIVGSRVWLALAVSLLIEGTGILQLFAAMQALSPAISLQAALLGYTVATLFLVLSPFLKGIGVIELALIYILTLYGFDAAGAASVTLLYRCFSFWLLVLAGLVSFLLSRGNLLLRIFPAVMIFILGLVNLVSGLSPVVHWRMRLIRSYLPIGTIHASNDFVIAAGVVLVVTAAFLLRGLRAAWVIALLVSLLSMVGHIFKAIDYEEAIFTALVAVVLMGTRSQYPVKSSRKRITAGIKIALLILLASLVFGVTGFYFLDKVHFGIDFGFSRSLGYTLQEFVLLDSGLVPHTRFAKGFLRVINVMGVGSLGFLFYTLIRPLVYRRSGSGEEAQFAYARSMVQQYGSSAVEYFKIYPDKLIFTSPRTEGFVSYKVANDFAITLGMPVCPPDPSSISRIMDDFERHCHEHGLRTAWYRIDEQRLPLFGERKRHALLIGQEAIVDVRAFTLEGKRRQNLRTARNYLVKRGYSLKILEPPVPANILQQMKAVSEDWLQHLNRTEMIFSQGMFLEAELKQQVTFLLEAPDGRIVAFLNLVPDGRPLEVRYDLIRKLPDEYAGCLDYLMVGLIDYCREKGYHYLNMGMAPMSGIEAPKNMQERTLKFAYEKIRRFAHYRGLRNFKEKFDPVWENKYLVYDHHFDLLLLPSALQKVMEAPVE